MWGYIIGGALVGTSPFCIILNFNNIKNLLQRTLDLSLINPNILLTSDEIAARRDKIILDSENLEMPSIAILDDSIGKIIKGCNKEELSLLKYHLQTIQVEKKKRNRGRAGEYLVKDNKIIICQDNAKEHELRHVASTVGIINNIIVTGFLQNSIKTDEYIGFGLNEGYTEYLGDKRTYQKAVRLIPLIELFYDDKDDLRQNYFNADLPAVINYFGQIEGREKAVELIRLIDIMTIHGMYSTWGNKACELELLVREELWDMYQKWSGKRNTEELFFTPTMLENYTPHERLKK